MVKSREISSKRLRMAIVGIFLSEKGKMANSVVDGFSLVYVCKS